VSADLIPLVVSQLRSVPLVAVLYLALIAVVVFAAVFAKTPDRRRAALAVLRMLLPLRRP